MSLALEQTTSNEWHVLKGESKFGPYTYSDMIQMMQNKTLFNFDYVWSPHLESWTALAELPEFSVDRLSRVAESTPEENGFSRRATERVSVSIPVLCHDNARMWKGTCENLSQGGALILMANPILLPGHLIYLHFRAKTSEETSFNCTAEILAKRLTKQRIQHDTGLHYAVKFLQILPAGQTQITSWVEAEAKKMKKIK